MNEDAPPDPNDPIDYAPLKWVGARAGDTIAASLQGGYGGMACPSDASETPETGGELEATLSANQISGKYTEVYGSGANAVTFHFHFVAQRVAGGEPEGDTRRFDVREDALTPVAAARHP